MEIALRLLDELHDVRVRFAGHRLAVDAEYAIAGAQTRRVRRTVFPDVFHKYRVDRLVGTHSGTPSQAQPLVAGQHLSNDKTRGYGKIHCTLGIGRGSGITFFAQKNRPKRFDGKEVECLNTGEGQRWRVPPLRFFYEP